MNDIRKHIDSLMTSEIVSIVEDYEQFEREGMIGDCTLRRHAQMFTIPDSGGIVTVMERVAFEAYRNIALNRINMQKG